MHGLFDQIEICYLALSLNPKLDGPKSVHVKTKSVLVIATLPPALELL